MPTLPLPLLDAAPRERADAARNRLRILEVAEELFAERGVQGVSMDCIAQTAGVGKGTLFRRFGDRAGLANALLQERAREFQEAFIRGPAPLGPGAEPVDRLVAFGRGLIEEREPVLEIQREAEALRPELRYAAGPWAAYLSHIRMLVAEACPELDPDVTAETLMAPLSATMIIAMRDGRGMTTARIADSWEALVRRLCDS